MPSTGLLLGHFKEGWKRLEELKVFSGKSNEPLAKEIIKHISGISACPSHLKTAAFLDLRRTKLGSRDIKTFSDGELYVRLDENVRGCDVFIIQSTNQPHENIIHFLMLVKAARDASAARITAVIPYFGYARQDRKDKSRACVSAVLMVQLLKSAGADRLLILDAHSSTVENAANSLDIRCDHLWAKRTFIDYLKSSEYFKQFMEEGFVVAGPDLNASKFARGYAEVFGAPLALIEKRRDVSSGRTSVLNVIGDVKDKNVLLVDDMIDTAGTTSNGADAFKDAGANRICALATHGVFSGGALGKIKESCIERVFVTDSIYHNYKADNFVMDLGGYKKLEILSVAHLLSEGILRIHANQSVSSLFE